jgi:MoxR-like ATPase
MKEHILARGPARSFSTQEFVELPSEDHEREVVARWNDGLIPNSLIRSIYGRFPIQMRFCIAARKVARARMEPGCSALCRRSRASHARASVHSLRRESASSVALLLCSKALAAIRGREFVTPDDVRDIALPVLRHRLTLRAEAELDGVTPDSVITDILKSVEVPR